MLRSPVIHPAAAQSTKPLRILHVVPTYLPAVRYGGPIRSVHGLCESLVRRGHRISVMTTNVDGTEDAAVPLDEPVDLDGVSVTYFPVPVLRRLYFSPTMMYALRKSIMGFDLVHLHSVFLWPTYAAARTARKAKVPYLMSPRGMLVPDLVRRKSRLIKTAWIKLVERRSLAGAAALHVTAEIEADQARAMGLPLPPIFCVPNGVACPGAHTPLAAGPFAWIPHPFALFLGRLNRTKGLDRLIRSWKWLPQLELIVAGNDDEDYLPELRRLAATEGVAERVHFVGQVADEHKWALFENAQMFVLPSYSENFGNVVAEAMAMGCPVVITPEVGLADLVSRTGAGVVTPGEPARLAQAIAGLQDDELRRRRLGSAGRQAVLDHLSWDGVAQQMEAAYLRLLEQSK